MKKTRLTHDQTGRPTKFDETMCVRVRQLASFGWSERQIATALRIAPSSVHVYERDHESFKDAITTGRQMYIDGVVEPEYLRQAAPHDVVTEIHALCGYGKRRHMRLVGKRIVKDVVDTSAAERILKSNKPEQYGDKVQYSGGISINLNVTKTYAGDNNGPLSCSPGGGGDGQPGRIELDLPRPADAGT